MECVPGHITTHGHWCEHGRFIVQESLGANLQHDLQNLQTLGFTYVTSMGDYLASRGVYPGSVFQARLPGYHLIEIPLGHVFQVIGQLYQRAGTTGLGRTIAAIEPDHVLDISAVNGKSVPLGTDFNLAGPGSSHAQYKAMLNLPAPNQCINGRGVKIAIIDTGLEAEKNAASFTDMVVPYGPQVDPNGHGTAMFEIIRDIAPGAEIHAVRVSKAETVFAWDLLAGIVAAIYDFEADIISISMGCKHLPFSCTQCGGAIGSRSFVCDHFFKLIASYPPKPKRSPVVVAAVGNDGNHSPFEWPARFSGVLAVGSINLRRQVSSFTNLAWTPGQEKSANEFCLCPGGDKNGDIVSEFVGTGQYNGQETRCSGTSPAAAYAAGVIALRRQQIARPQVGRSILGGVIMDARPDIVDANGAVGGTPDLYGSGRLVFAREARKVAEIKPAG